MMIYDCKCDECQAEFQAVLENDKDTVKCPSCESTKVAMTESETQPGCGGGCGNCGGGCATE